MYRSAEALGMTEANSRVKQNRALKKLEGITTMIWNNYKKQLRQDATNATEAAELAALARRISQLKVPALSAKAKARIADDLGFTARRSMQPWMLGFGAMAAIALIAVVTLAQYSHPGSALYSVKHQSDRLQQFIHTETGLTPVPNSDDKSSNGSAGQHQSGTDERHGVTASPTPGVKSSDDKGGATPTPVPTTSGGSSTPSGGGGTSGGGGSTPGGGGTSGGHGGTPVDDSPTSGGSGH